MSKPKPKSELIVKRNSPEDNQPLHIYYSTEDARVWIEEQAQPFGILTYLKASKLFSLTVSPLYDIDEVVEYLVSYNGNQAEPADKQE